MKKETENWLKIAKNDLKIAKALFKEGLYSGVIEHGHAALEKLIKGIIVEQNREPPKIHNLLRLVSMTLIQNVQEDIKITFEELNDLYFSVRYPENFDEVQIELSIQKITEIFNKINDIFKLLEKNIQ